MRVNLSRRCQLSGKYLLNNHSNRLFPKKVELQALMKYYDVDHDGSVSYEEFISGLR